MGWFSGIQEIRRLSAENEKLGGKVAFLEKERERLITENRERDLAWADRFLTQSGNYAMADEAKGKAKAQNSDVQRLNDIKLKEELQAHLDSVHAQLRQDAIDAQLPVAEADALFARNREEYTQQFYDNSGPFF